MELLPQSSTAVHVRVTLYDPAHAPLVVTSLKVRLNALPHASVAVAVANDGVAGQSIVTGAGSAAMTGAVLSMTCMVWLAVDALPHPSVAVQVRVTLYWPAHGPLVVTSLKTSVKLLPHPSVAVGVANDGVAGQKIVDGAGKEEITGAVTSCTWMTCALVEAFPHTSSAVQVRVTV